MTEIIFAVEDAPEEGYLARAIGESIFTQAESRRLSELHERGTGRRAVPFRRRNGTETDPSAFRKGSSDCGMRLPRDLSRRSAKALGRVGYRVVEADRQPSSPHPGWVSPAIT